jgi:glutamate-1-semialdehyde 2,1-aminomutase
MLSVHFSKAPINDFASASSANNEQFNTFFHKMLQQGIYLPPSAFESWFLNDALTYEDLDNTIAASY